MIEVWRSVLGYEGSYEVSSIGRVRSVDRTTVASNGHVKSYKGQLLAQGLSSHGYPVVNLVRNGRGSTKAVHSLVLGAFVGPKPDKCEACHQNCDKTDNRLENLRWDTRAANLADSSKAGRLVGRRGQPRNKLTVALVTMARYRYSEGESLSALAREIGVRDSTLCQAIRGITWKSI